MPNVLLDLRMVRGDLHGIARYALELARLLPALAPDWSFRALVGPEPLPTDLGDLFPTLPLVRCAARFLSPVEQPALLGSLLTSGCDLFHATSFSLPALWPGKLVATLHDANHLALERNDPLKRAYYRLIVGPRSHTANALITVSEFSRAELARHLSLEPARLQVISPGVAGSFVPPTTSSIAAFRKRMRLPPRYFAAIGNAKPFKNLPLLAKLAPQLPAPIALLAGAGTARRLGFPEDTIDLGRLSEEELHLFYGAATALLLPSRYEGFGLPALEAMACGCPVIAARAGSLPEVVGEAGLLIEPGDEAGWMKAATSLAGDEQLRRELSARGLVRASRFTWESCARQSLEVYRRALRIS